MAAASSEFVELVLKCGSLQEAQAIADALLDNHLVACVEFQELKSKYHWEGAIEEATEIKLVMETVAENFKAIENEVKRLHSYETFVLRQIPITNVSEKARAWWIDETKAKN